MSLSVLRTHDRAYPTQTVRAACGGRAGLITTGGLGAGQSKGLLLYGPRDAMPTEACPASDPPAPLSSRTPVSLL